MVNLLNLTTLAISASSTPVNILDNTKSFALDVVDSGCADYTSVQALTVGDTPERQEWILSPSGVDTFQITNTNCNTTLTYTGSVTGTNTRRAQTTTIYGSDTMWQTVLVDSLQPSGPFQLIESISGMAVTVWGADVKFDAHSSAITLESRPSDPRQQLYLAEP